MDEPTSPSDITLLPLQARLGYRFQDIQHLITALTRRSAAGEGAYEDETYVDSEFRGDRVLNLAVADLIKQHHPYLEGKEKNDTYVRYTRNSLPGSLHGGPLYRIAKHLWLARYLVKGDGDPFDTASKRAEEGMGRKAVKRTQEGILSDHVEAIIGAVYEDCDHNMPQVKEVIAPHLSKLGLNEDEKEDDYYGDSDSEERDYDEGLIQLSEAVYMRRPEDVKTLLSHGVPATVQLIEYYHLEADRERSRENVYIATPLHHLIESVLDAGLTNNLTDRAFFDNGMAIFSLLLVASDLNARDSAGSSVMDRALLQYYFLFRDDSKAPQYMREAGWRIVQDLIQAGADINGVHEDYHHDMVRVLIDMQAFEKLKGFLKAQPGPWEINALAFGSEFCARASCMMHLVDDLLARAQNGTLTKSTCQAVVSCLFDCGLKQPVLYLEGRHTRNMLLDVVLARRAAQYPQMAIISEALRGHNDIKNCLSWQSPFWAAARETITTAAEPPAQYTPT